MDEWDALPWWQRRMYVSGMIEEVEANRGGGRGGATHSEHRAFTAADLTSPEFGFDVD